ncbi:hypothetical protein [Actinokineospora sp. NBRC 105648]|uniref:hypothetical protein n=1 Tax=Actinokineospora sp. NBRC 105648 TaxID=3032206 RepID=UPI0024A2550D|nr:hypothetical protein [Actinokineospora sp. NBRC 105648]GLZ38091.1 hypothetical protein Acsp05_17150 [Actinokineospora sp. NBRC 105648]
MRRAGALTAGLLAVVPFITGAAAARDGCWSTAPIELTNQGVWKYTNQISWCARGSGITSVAMTVTHQVLDQACRWVGRVEESDAPAKDGTGRTVYDQSEFECSGTIGTGGVNPWVVVTVQPNGTYTVDMSGIG